VFVGHKDLYDLIGEVTHSFVVERLALPKTLRVAEQRSDPRACPARLEILGEVTLQFTS